MCQTHHFNQLWDGNFKLHRDWIRDVLHGSDELVVASEELPEQPVLCFGGEAAWMGKGEEEEGRLNTEAQICTLDHTKYGKKIWVLTKYFFVLCNKM